MEQHEVVILVLLIKATVCIISYWLYWKMERWR